MKATLITTANVDVKTGEVYEKLLDFDIIFDSDIIYKVLCCRSSKKFRSCNARIVEYGMYTYLISYNTVIGMLDRHTGTFYDALRVVYGYTATSAQHISKFCNDYPVFSIYRYVTE